MNYYAISGLCISEKKCLECELQRFPEWLRPEIRKYCVCIKENRKCRYYYSACIAKHLDVRSPLTKSYYVVEPNKLDDLLWLYTFTESDNDIDWLMLVTAEVKHLDSDLTYTKSVEIWHSASDIIIHDRWQFDIHFVDYYCEMFGMAHFWSKYYLFLKIATRHKHFDLWNYLQGLESDTMVIADSYNGLNLYGHADWEKIRFFQMANPRHKAQILRSNCNLPEICYQYDNLINIDWSIFSLENWTWIAHNIISQIKCGQHLILLHQAGMAFQTGMRDNAQTFYNSRLTAFSETKNVNLEYLGYGKDCVIYQPTVLDYLRQKGYHDYLQCLFLQAALHGNISAMKYLHADMPNIIIKYSLELAITKRLHSSYPESEISDSEDTIAYLVETSESDMVDGIWNKMIPELNWKNYHLFVNANYDLPMEMRNHLFQCQSTHQFLIKISDLTAIPDQEEWPIVIEYIRSLQDKDAILQMIRDIHIPLDYQVTIDKSEYFPFSQILTLAQYLIFIKACDAVLVSNMMESQGKKLDVDELSQLLMPHKINLYSCYAHYECFYEFNMSSDLKKICQELIHNHMLSEDVAQKLQFCISHDAIFHESILGPYVNYYS